MKKKIIGIFIVMLFLVSAYSGTSEINTTNIDSENVEFLIELDDLPETLIFDKENLPAPILEYSWHIAIDVDGDENTGYPSYASINGVDVFISVEHYKFDGAEQHEDTILNACQFYTSVWNDQLEKFEEGHTIEDKIVDVDSDVIKLFCPKSWEEISEIDMSDNIGIFTIYYDENTEVHLDTAFGEGFVIDPVGDASPEFIDIIRGGISMPTSPEITGDASGKAGKEKTYSFSSIDNAGLDLYYYIEWGDGEIDEWVGPYASGEEAEITHVWEEKGDYIIKAKSKNINDVVSDWATLEVSMPKNRAANTPFLQFLENHPHLFPILRQLLRL